MTDRTITADGTLEVIDGQLHELGPVADWEDADPELAGRVLSEVMLTA